MLMFWAIDLVVPRFYCLQDFELYILQVVTILNLDDKLEVIIRRMIIIFRETIPNV